MSSSSAAALPDSSPRASWPPRARRSRPRGARRIGVPVHCTGVLGLDAFDELDLPGAPSSAPRTPRASSPRRQRRRHRRRARARGGRRSRDLRPRSRRIGRAAGATIRTGARVAASRASRSRSPSRTADAGGVTDARARCVLACGANYRFNRALGLGVPSVFVHSAQLEVAVSPTRSSGGAPRAQGRARRVRVGGAVRTRRARRSRASA